MMVAGFLPSGVMKSGAPGNAFRSQDILKMQELTSTTRIQRYTC